MTLSLKRGTSKPAWRVVLVPGLTKVFSVGGMLIRRAVSLLLLSFVSSDFDDGPFIELFEGFKCCRTELLVFCWFLVFLVSSGGT